MKRFVLALSTVVLAATTLSTSAFAMSQPERRTLVTIRASAGLVPEGKVMQEIQLRNDGSVLVTELFRTRDNSRNGYRDETRTHESLWFETPEIMQKIYTATLQIKGSELKDQQPDRPAYADGMYISYELTSSDKAIVFARSSGGKDFLPADRTEAKAARYLRADLDALRAAINADVNADEKN